MKKLIIRLFVFIFLCLFITVLIFGLSGYVKYRNAIKTISLENRIKEVQSNESYVVSKNMSKDFKAAIVAVEDHRFYNHLGIDVFATTHAILVNIFSGSFDYGASGITQQVGRMLYFTQERSPTRKIAELFVALDLEKNYSKDEILDLYVNMAYYGEGYYGIGEASHGFFNKKPSKLSKDESAYLAGLPNAPSIYSTSDKLGEERKNQVLNSMEKYKDEIYK